MNNFFFLLKVTKSGGQQGILSGFFFVLFDINVQDQAQVSPCILFMNMQYM